MNRVCKNPRVIEVDYVEIENEPQNRKVARSVMSMFADSLVSPNDGVVGRLVLSERHYHSFKCHDICAAIEQWVSHAWYENGKAYFKLSQHIQ